MPKSKKDYGTFSFSVKEILKLRDRSQSTSRIFEHYQHVDNAQKRMAVERFPEIGNVLRFMCTKENGSLPRQ